MCWYSDMVTHEELSRVQIAEACDENTIGVVAILGTTYSGHFEDVAAIDAAIGALPASRAHGMYA